jgi:hypothetical protein
MGTEIRLSSDRQLVKPLGSRCSAAMRKEEFILVRKESVKVHFVGHLMNTDETAIDLRCHFSVGATQK